MSAWINNRTDSAPTAVLLLPASSLAGERGSAHRRWLSRGSVTRREPPFEALDLVLEALGIDAPAAGRAALRRCGHGDVAAGRWYAAADPVHLETRLSHLALRALLPNELDGDDLRDVFGALQATLGEDGEFSFDAHDGLGYVSGGDGFATAAHSPAALDGLNPERHTPQGPAAAGLHRMLGEIQLVLHAHASNIRRESRGLRAVNSLWLWGGGALPDLPRQPLPALHGDEPLLRGFWACTGGRHQAGCAGILHCLETSPEGFVADMSTIDGEQFGAELEVLKHRLRKGALGRVTILTTDGVRATLERRDLIRFWRVTSPVFSRGEADA